jgi:hypothetical protein
LAKLEFEDFHPDLSQIILIARTPKGILRFLLGAKLIADELHAEHPSMLDHAIKDCRDHRDYIIAACRRAYLDHPRARDIELQSAHFRDAAA